MTLQDRLAALTSPYDACRDLECDGLTWVLHRILTSAGIPHSCHIGIVREKSTGRIVPLHVWTTVRDLHIDYRARMWLGPAAPHGVFLASEHPNYAYEIGQTVEPIELDNRLFAVLTMGMHTR